MSKTSITVAGETVNLRPLILDDLLNQPELLKELSKAFSSEKTDAGEKWNLDISIVIANLLDIAAIVAAGCDKSVAWIGKRTLPEFIQLAQAVLVLNLDIISVMIPDMPQIKIPGQE